MASLNRVLIMGHLGQDPEIRYTANQTAVATLNVATTENWMGKDGVRQENTEWHRIIVWGKQAENCGKYLSKGRAVFIEGRLQTRSWDDKNGQKRYTTEINASNVQFMPSNGQGARPNNGNYTQGPSEPFGGAAQQHSAPANNFANNNTSFPQADTSNNTNNSSNIPDLDDIPF